VAGARFILESIVANFIAVSARRMLKTSGCQFGKPGKHGLVLGEDENEVSNDVNKA
jgi:hypothetical protein